MTGTALTFEVIGGLIHRVAGRAINQTQVIDAGWNPYVGGVTTAALAGKVNRWLVDGMARGAIGLAGVIERRRNPGCG